MIRYAGPPLGGGKKCARCEKSVYHNELRIGAGQDYHKQCFTCCFCNKGLDSTNLSDFKVENNKRTNENNNNEVKIKDKYEICCKGCYNKNFGPKGYGYGQGAGALYNTGK